MGFAHRVARPALIEGDLAFEGLPLVERWQRREARLPRARVRVRVRVRVMVR